MKKTKPDNFPFCFLHFKQILFQDCDIFFAQSNENNPQKIESLQYAQIGNVGMVKVNWNEKTS